MNSSILYSSHWKLKELWLKDIRKKKECYKIVQNVTCPSLTRYKITSWPPFAQYMYQE